MKTLVTILFAGTMLALTVNAADPGAAERFRMKTGRTPDAAPVACEHGCCRHQAGVAVNDGGSAARFQAKWGRSMNQPKATPVVAASQAPLVADNGAAARFRMKFGRSLPESQPVVTAAPLESENCGMPCCNHAD